MSHSAVTFHAAHDKMTSNWHHMLIGLHWGISDVTGLILVMNEYHVMDKNQGCFNISLRWFNNLKSCSTKSFCLPREVHICIYATSYEMFMDIAQFLKLKSEPTSSSLKPDFGFEPTRAVGCLSCQPEGRAPAPNPPHIHPRIHSSPVCCNLDQLQ